MKGANMKQSGKVNHNFKARTMKEELGIDKVNISSFINLQKKHKKEKVVLYLRIVAYTLAGFIAGLLVATEILIK